MLEGYYHIGKIFKKFSYKGEVLIKIRKEIPDIFDISEPVYLLLEDTPVPFFMEKISWQKEDVLRVKFEDIDSDSKAGALLKKSVYIPRERMPKTSGTDFFEDEILGFQVQDIRFGSLGTVVGVNTSTPQTLLEVANPEGLLYIPAEAFILNIDRKANRIEVEVPDGLTDLRQ